LRQGTEHTGEHENSSGGWRLVGSRRDETGGAFGDGGDHASVQINKSFLVLFFKKALLSSSSRSRA
jgi:hypothetical protein